MNIAWWHRLSAPTTRWRDQRVSPRRVDDSVNSKVRPVVAFLERYKLIHHICDANAAELTSDRTDSLAISK
jgi:hypothetical protein